MTPVSLKSLRRPTTQDQSQLIISANNHHSTSLSCCTFFHILDQTQTQDIRDLRHLECPPQQDGKIVFDIGSSKHTQVCNSSSVKLEAESVMEDPSSECGHHNLSLYKIEDQEYKKWMSSNVRLTRKMMSPPRSDLATKKAFNTITRVCADCNTTTTPLWRSGPNGPKSLCNACGIRQRKARRAMAEAANGFSLCMNSSSTKIRVHNKEKKSGANHFAGFKNKLKATTTAAAAAGTSQQEEQVKNNSVLKQVFPMDEVAEAALLLMDLSSGFVYL